MSTLTSSLIVRLVDGITKPARGAAKSLRDLNAVATGRGSWADRMGVAQAGLGAAIAKNNNALSIHRGKLLDAAAAFYTLKTAIVAPLDAARDFETMMEDIGQKADIPVEKLGALGDAIRKVARDTNQSTMDIGHAVDFLIGMGAAEDIALAVSAPIGKAATAYRAATEDLGKATFAVVDNLKVDATDAGYALDIMAKAGKEGGFELKDMAKEFPGLTASAQFLGMRGTKAVADLAAALEVARKGASDGATAANNMANFLQKINSPRTLKNFREFGVSVPKELAKAAKAGESPIEHMLDIIQRLTKGDSTKLGELFQDKQVLEAIKPLLANMDEYRRIRDEALSSQGTVEEDYARRIETAAGVQQRFQAAMNNLAVTLGQKLVPAVNQMLDVIIPVTDKLGVWIDEHPKLTAAVLESVAAVTALKASAALLTFAGLIGKGGALTAVSLGLKAITAAATPVAGIFETIALRSALAGASLGKAPGLLAGIGDAMLVVTRALGAPALLDALAGLAPLLGPIALAGAAIAAAGKFIHDNWDGLGAMWQGVMEGLKPVGPALEDLKAAFAPLQPVLDAAGAALGSILSPLQPIVDAIVTLPVSTEQWTAWGKSIGDNAAASVQQLVGGIKELLQFLGQALDVAGRLGTAIRNLWDSGGSSAQTMLAPGQTPLGTLPAPSGGYADAMSGRVPLSGHRARGGNVWPGGSFLVGENEPEVFTPSKSGDITPLSKAGGISVSVGDLHFHGVGGDPYELRRSVERGIEEALRSVLQGIHSDQPARS